MWLRRFGLCILMTVMCGLAATATALDKAEIEKEQADRLAFIGAQEKLVTDPDSTNVILDAVREKIRTSRSESRALIVKLENLRSEVEAQLAEMGPAPEENGPAEASVIAEKRDKLTKELSEVNQSIAQSEFIATQAARLLEEIADIQQTRFFDEVLTSGPIPIHPVTWLAGISAFWTDLTRATEILVAWWKSIEASGDILRTGAILVGTFLFAGIMMFPARYWLWRGLDEITKHENPTPHHKVMALAARIFFRLIPAGLVAGMAYLAFNSIDILTPETKPIFMQLGSAFFLYVYVEAFSRALFAPTQADWRMIRVSTPRAWRMYGLLSLMALVYGVHVVLKETTLVLSSSVELSAIQAGGTGALFAIGFWLLSRRYMWKTDGSDQGQSSSQLVTSLAPKIRGFITIFAILLLLASAFGYVALTDYVVTLIVHLAVLISAFWLLRALIRNSLEKQQFLRREALQPTGTTDDTSGNQENFFLFWVWFAVDAVLFIVLLPILLLITGVDWRDIADLGRQAIYGFKIGDVTISIAEFFWAMLAFVAVLLATRVVQKTLENRIFPKTRLNIGVRNSFVTLTGYVGLVIAVFLAIRVVGFDLSSLAIIAGALSVGIGFGLQSIVNNFVSGLILLFERPIKVGDWIVTSSGEGTVKRISVRSTEIETFDRCSIIIPNSELITSPVQNWTHKDKIGRVIVPVGVSYNSDPSQVREILHRVAMAHPLVLNTPPPFIYWKEFGASSLDFEVRIFLRDISNLLVVRNDLRFAIFDALKKANIEIPFPQHDLHLKDIDRLENLIETIRSPASPKQISE